MKEEKEEMNIIFTIELKDLASTPLSQSNANNRFTTIYEYSVFLLGNALTTVRGKRRICLLYIPCPSKYFRTKHFPKMKNVEVPVIS